VAKQNNREQARNLQTTQQSVSIDIHLTLNSPCFKLTWKSRGCSWYIHRVRKKMEPLYFCL